MADLGADRREGRGRLSSIDLLPDECEADIVWALEQLRERAMPQNAILDEFNARLADRGVGKVSKSAFSRWSVRKAIAFRRLDETRTIAGDIVAGLGTGGAEEVTLAISEMIKAAIYASLEGENDSKSILELSRALNSVTTAQKVSGEDRRKREAEVAARLEQAKATVAEVGGKRGVSPATLAEINARLGAV